MTCRQGHTQRSTRRQGWLVLLVAVLALGATVTVRPPDAPPLYDGIGFPDEPYRWVEPPPGQTRTPVAATAAAAKIAVKAGTGSGPVSQAARGFSTEQGPQVAFAVTEGAFSVPGGATSVQLTASPKAIPAPYGRDGAVVSNLYVFSAVSDGKKAVTLTPSAVLIVNLRAFAATEQVVVLCQWNGSQWTQVPTRQVGTEIYAAQLPGLDPVALVRLNPGVSATVAAPSGRSTAATGGAGAAAPADTGSGSSRILLLVVGGVVILLAGGLLVLRRRGGEEE